MLRFHQIFFCKAYIINFSKKVVIAFKVEKILKGNLDLIPSPSPSVKIQIMGGKVCWRCKGKTSLGIVNELFEFNIEFIYTFAFISQHK